MAIWRGVAQLGLLPLAGRQRGKRRGGDLQLEFNRGRWYNRRVLPACVGEMKHPMRAMVVREAGRKRFVNYAHSLVSRVLVVSTGVAGRMVVQP